MQNIIIVDLDTEREETVRICKPKVVELIKASRELICLDMATLCEGLVALIHVADQHGFKPSAESLRLCMEHLQAGFGDADYKGFLGSAISGLESPPSTDEASTSS